MSDAEKGKKSGKTLSNKDILKSLKGGKTFSSEDFKKLQKIYANLRAKHYKGKPHLETGIRDFKAKASLKPMKHGGKAKKRKY